MSTRPPGQVEVGASAGLCLLSDLYGYDYGAYRVYAKEVQGDGPAFTEIVDRAGMAPTLGQFLMSVNGSPVAWTDLHGVSLE